MSYEPKGLGAGSSSPPRHGERAYPAGKRSLTQRLSAWSGAADPAPPGPPVQRKAAAGSLQDALDSLAEMPPVSGGLGEMRIEAAAPVQRRGDGLAADDVHAAAARGISTPRSPLPYRSELETSLGRDLSGVQAHVGGAGEAAARDIGAEAYASGDHVVLPAHASLHTVAHEVTHVLQQRGGDVQLSGGVGAAGDRYETEADDVADAVVRGERVDVATGHGGGLAAVQRRELGAAAADDARDLPAGFEELIGGTLAMTVAEGDAAAARTRATLLGAQLRALHRAHRRVLARRLAEPAQNDALAAAFQQRLSTPQRGRLLAILGDDAPAATEEEPGAEAGAAAPAGEEEAVLQSPDPAIDGRTVSDVGAELHAKAKGYASEPARQQAYALGNQRDEKRILDDHDGVFGTLVNLFNDAAAPSPERWNKAIVDWGTVQQQLQAVLVLQPTAANIRLMGELTEKGLTGWHAAMAQTSAYSDEMLRYLKEFSQLAGTINTGVQITADIAMAAAITCAVIATGPAILAIGAKAATAVGATGATAIAVKGTTAVLGAGVIGSVTRGGLQAGRTAGYEGIDVLVEYSRTEKSLREAAESFDWARIGRDGWDGAKKGFVDGVLAHGGLAMEAVATRLVGKAVAQYLGPYAGKLYAQILRRAAERAITAGVAGGVSGALDAGARAAIDGKSLPGILAAMEDGATLGAVVGGAVGGAVGANDIRRAAKLDRHADELATLYGGDRAAFSARYSELADELPPDQLGDLMAGVRGRLAPGRAGAIEQGQARIRELHAAYEFDDASFHGTGSAMLGGLEKTDGEILSAAELARRGHAQPTGEGSSFSGADGLKEDISIGHGESGFGTSLAYADVADSLRHYNPELLTWHELNTRIRDLQDSLRSFEKLRSSLPERGPLASPLDSRAKIEEKLARLNAELRHRLTLKPWDPRRIGGRDGMESYPVMFEFDTAGLPVEHRGIRPGGALGGEASVNAPIDLRTRLRRVYVPADRVPEVTGRLQKLLGHDQFEVLPLEATNAVPAGGLTESSRAATNVGLADLEKRFEAASRAYAGGHRNGGQVDVNTYFMEVTRR
jgi:hypothetical protein